MADDEAQIGDGLRYLAGEARGAGLDDLGSLIDCVIPGRVNYGTTADRQIDLVALATFIAVAEAGTFTAAAERLGVTQAAVSLQIGRLEDNVGARLFERGARGASLLDAGRTLMPFARAMLNLNRATQRALSVHDPLPARPLVLHFPQLVAGE